MAVYDSTLIKDTRYLLSRTPKNLVTDNYFHKELQQKIDADWRFRPNRVDIEKETGIGTEEYEKKEVVLQSLKNDNGTSISEDWARIVYRDIREPVRLGERMKFSYNFGLETEDINKSIWIVLNQNQYDRTQSQVVCRCNNTLGHVYTDEHGNDMVHYEPVIFLTDQNSGGFQFSQVTVYTKTELQVIAQHNKFTRQWFINQRFVIGYDQVYKVDKITKIGSRKTYDSQDVALVKMELTIDQISDLDNFDTRIAYNGVKDIPVIPETDSGYELKLVGPTSYPEVLTEFTFKPCVYLNGEATDETVTVTFALNGPHAEVAELSNFVGVEQLSDGSYTLTRLASDPGLSVKVNCQYTVSAETTLELEWSMLLFGV